MSASPSTGRARLPIGLAGLAAALLLGIAVQAAQLPGGSTGNEPTTLPSGAASPAAVAQRSEPSVPAASPVPSEVVDPTATPADAAAAPPAPTASQLIASGPTYRVATRVAVPGLGIDLPVIRQVTRYPPCRVAMYLPSLKQPGQDGVTYLYAHAQVGMFLPLLRASQVSDGRAMLGMDVLVYTGDGQLFRYRISEVRRHVTTLTGARQWKGESAWLQTSEGRGIPQKLQVVASFVDLTETDFASAHPLPRPVTC